MFKAGDMGDAAYVIIEGKVEISVPTPSGPIVVNTVGRNDIIGEIAIFGDVPRTATATVGQQTETPRISKELFEKIIRENPDAALELIRVLAGRLANDRAALPHNYPLKKGQDPFPQKGRTPVVRRTSARTQDGLQPKLFGHAGDPRFVSARGEPRRAHRRSVSISDGAGGDLRK